MVKKTMCERCVAAVRRMHMHKQRRVLYSGEMHAREINELSIYENNNTYIYVNSECKTNIHMYIIREQKDEGGYARG